MKLKELYELIIELGINQDPRGKAVVEKEISGLKQTYDSLSGEEREEFDRERLNNPYSDTRILQGNPEEEIRRVLIGIDIDVGEVLLADRLREKGRKIDLIIAHHPEGRALAGLHRVMHMHTDILHGVGVPVNVVESLMGKRISEVERRLLPVNHTKVNDAAKLLDIPLMCVHTPADNHVSTFLQKLLDEKKPETLESVIKILKQIPEYQRAVRENAGPKIVNGESDFRPGKIFVDMTGGTEGSKDIFERLSQAGIGTIVGMHISDDHLKKAREQHINVIIAGHISSDTLGVNLILDSIEKKQPLDVLECSGFVRIRRK